MDTYELYERHDSGLDVSNIQRSVTTWFTPSGVFACGKCDTVANTKEDAEACCVCRVCGLYIEKSNPHYYRLHEACARENNLKELRLQHGKERAGILAAPKADPVTYTGWVYNPFGMGPNGDGYAESIESMAQFLLRSADTPKPEFVWTCNETILAPVRVDDFIEGHYVDQLAEGQEHDLEGKDELQAALNKFAEVNKEIVSYTPNMKLAIRVPYEAHNEDSGDAGKPDAVQNVPI